MVKKLFAVVLVFSVLIFVTVPSFADTQEEKDARQGRAVLAAIGIVALVGAIFMMSKINFNDTYFTPGKNQNKKFSVGLDYSDSEIKSDLFEERNEFRSPELKISYNW